MSDISDMMYEQGYHDGYQLALSELNSKKFEKVIRCPECKYKKTCISTTNGIDPYGFCKWGEKDGDQNV